MNTNELIIEAIENLDKRIAELIKELEVARNQRAHLVNAQKETLSTSKGKYKSPDAIEEVLREAETPLSSDEITERIKKLGFAVGKQAVTSTLVRYNAKGKRFIRIGTNLYDLEERVK